MALAEMGSTCVVEINQPAEMQMGSKRQNERDCVLAVACAKV